MKPHMRALLAFFALCAFAPLAGAQSLDVSLADLEAAAQAGEASRITAWLHSGQTDAVTERAVELLGELGRAETLPTLAGLRRHRRTEVRLRAYVALSRVKAPGVSALVAAGLRDPSARVRGAAATALGRIGAKDALPLLWVALERGVGQAALAIGQLASEEGIARLHTELGRVPLKTLLPGYRALLLREDLPLPAKQDIAARLTELSGATVATFFETLLAHDAQRLPAKLRTGLERDVRRLRAGSATP